MESASYYSISCPARFCEERDVFETLDVIVDIENGKIELISEDRKNVIRLGLMGADTLKDCLLGVTGSEHFQNALGKEISKHLGRLNTINGTVP